MREFSLVRFRETVLRDLAWLLNTTNLASAQSLAAYPLARMRFAGRGLVLALVVATILIPFQVVMIPLYLLMVQLGLRNTLWALILPQAATGIASTAIFCLIFAWNEYAFAVLLTSGTAQTAPPFIPTIIGVGGQDWPAVAAGATIFLLPVMIFTILLRKHLLRGITFGAVRK